MNIEICENAKNTIVGVSICITIICVIYFFSSCASEMPTVNKSRLAEQIDTVLSTPPSYLSKEQKEKIIFALIAKNNSMDTYLDLMSAKKGMQKKEDLKTILKKHNIDIDKKEFKDNF